MRHHTIDMYARNTATRRFAHGPGVADLGATIPLDCPFCGRPTTTRNGAIMEHLENYGFTRCPAVGGTIAEAQHKARSLRADYKLPNEGSWNG